MYTPQSFREFLLKASYEKMQQTTDMITHLADMLQKEEQKAEDNGIRPHAFLTIESYNSASTANMTQKEKAAVEEQNRQWHDWATNRTHLVYNPNERGIDTIGAAAHEAEHANQTVGHGYSPTQLTMIWIARALYKSPKVDKMAYRNNYTEIAARIAEAKFYIHAYDMIKNDPKFTVHEKDAMLRVLMDRNFQLCRGVTEKNLHSLLQSQIRELKSWFGYTDEMKTALQYAIPGKNNFGETRKGAITFLESEGQHLNDEIFKEMKGVSQQLEDIIHQLEKDTKDNRIHTIAQDNRNYIAELAQYYEIPFIALDAATPFPQHADDLERDSVAVQIKFEHIRQNFHNPAIVKLNGNLHLIYDDVPQYRPYGDKPKQSEPKQPERLPENHLDLNQLIDEAETNYTASDPNHYEMDISVR